MKKTDTQKKLDKLMSKSLESGWVMGDLVILDIIEKLRKTFTRAFIFLAISIALLAINNIIK